MHWKFCDEEGKARVSGAEEEERLAQSSWSEVEFSTIREAASQALLDAEKEVASQEVYTKHDEEAWAFWDKFYHQNEDKFFKDRTYLHLEFPEELNPCGVTRNTTPEFLAKPLPPPLESYEKRILEAGSGVGNTLFPLLRLNHDKYFYAFDFSPHAIDILRTHPDYDTKRVTAFVGDPTSLSDFPSVIPPESIDTTMMVFFLSAVSSEKMPNVLQNIYKLLKPGGTVVIRDYGMYDMTQMRFLHKKGRKLGENFYMRTDGTRSYFFSTEKLQALFEAAGFVTTLVKYDTRELRNRKRKISMYRVWVRGKFTKPLTNAAN
jgi:SAM-dependent methyltransferase